MEIQNGIGNDKHSELIPETKHHQYLSEPKTEGSLPGIKIHPEPRHDDKEEQATQDVISGLGQHPEESIEASRLSRSSSSSASADDELHQDGYQYPELDVATQTPQWSMMSGSPRGGSGTLSSPGDVLPNRTPEWVMSNSSPMKSPPPVQAMGQGYDPNRIPSSVFSPKPTSPMDWSVTSNESLFSIHMGNSSFSRDNFALQGVPEEDTNHASSSPSPKYSDARRQNDSRTNMYVRPGLEEEFEETPKVVRGETGEYHSKDAYYGARLSTSSGVPIESNRVSNESTQSCDSFAFPVLCDGAKGSSLKGVPEKTAAAQPQPRPQQTQAPDEDPKPSPNEASACWFSCFSCCWPTRCC